MRTAMPHMRVGMPAALICALTAAMGTSRRWKMPAASAADARVRANTSEKCSGHPAPEDAMTGIVTAADTAATSSMSKPEFLHEQYTELSFT